MSFSLEGRVAVVFGVANKRSIAWSIAQGLHQAGAKLAITYQNERLEQEAKDLILSLPGAEGFMCDVSRDEDIERVFSQLKERADGPRYSWTRVNVGLVTSSSDAAWKP